jgi:hypothetical protein
VPQRKVAAIFKEPVGRCFLEEQGISHFRIRFVVIKPFSCAPQIFGEFFRNPRDSGDSILNKIRGLPLV